MKRDESKTSLESPTGSRCSTSPVLSEICIATAPSYRQCSLKASLHLFSTLHFYASSRSHAPHQVFFFQLPVSRISMIGGLTVCTLSLDNALQQKPKVS